MVESTLNERSPRLREIKAFWLGFFVAGVIILLPTIYSLNTQKDFIVILEEVLSLYNEQSTVFGGLYLPSAFDQVPELSRMQ
jgi:hypothetical protein